MHHELLEKNMLWYIVTDIGVDRRSSIHDIIYQIEAFWCAAYIPNDTFN